MRLKCPAEVELRDVAVARELMRRMNAGNLDGPGDADEEEADAPGAAAERSPLPTARPPR